MICKVMGAGIWRTSGGGGFDTKPDAERVSSVLMGCAWGEVVEAGASKNEPATERERSVMTGDEARAGKIAWASPPTTAASALRPVMVRAGMRAGDADNGGEGVWEAGARKNEWGWDICPPSPLVGALRLVMV